jgi:hypothetical protein
MLGIKKNLRGKNKSVRISWLKLSRYVATVMKSYPYRSSLCASVSVRVVVLTERLAMNVKHVRTTRKLNIELVQKVRILLSYTGKALQEKLKLKEIELYVINVVNKLHLNG